MAGRGDNGETVDQRITALASPEGSESGMEVAEAGLYFLIGC